MSLTLDLRQEAAEDIRENVRYLARDSENVAVEFERDVRECLMRLAEFPGMGALVRKQPLVRKMRVSQRFGDWLILYRPTGKLLEILRVLHGARNMRALIRDVK